MAKKVLTHNLSEALGSVDTADVNIDPGDGNLAVDGLTGNEQELASGTLQYLEKNGLPPGRLTRVTSRPASQSKPQAKDNPGCVSPGQHAMAQPTGRSTSIAGCPRQSMPTAMAAISNSTSMACL